MCTVSYIPLKKNGFLLTSNRDEAVNRATVIFPSTLTTNKSTVYFPKDGLAGGSWIACSENLTACLLNGAYLKHERAASYKISRGLMLLAAFSYKTVQQFIADYDFKEIEPFTLILVYKNETINLFEIRWDGSQLHFKELAAQKPYIWASATLYSPDVISQRQAMFDTLLHDFNYTQEEIIHFHSFKTEDHENGIMMNRGEKQTISITSIKSTSEATTMLYTDLMNPSTKTINVI